MAFSIMDYLYPFIAMDRREIQILSKSWIVQSANGWELSFYQINGCIDVVWFQPMPLDGNVV
jgi:hypothetical protein